jgi:hypothetical protein
MRMREAARRGVMVAMVVLLLHLPAACSLITRVPHGSEVCFHERAARGDKVVANFRVLEGGRKDIDVKVNQAHIS